jgi:hypothetical protein
MIYARALEIPDQVPPLNEEGRAIQFGDMRRLIAVKNLADLLNLIMEKLFVVAMIRKILSKPFLESDVDNFSFKFAGNRDHQISKRPHSSASENYEKFRRQLDPRILSITPDLIEWLRILPDAVRPKNMILKFPRVAHLGPLRTVSKSVR